ncbi:MAG: ABC transporter ATP-binding protein [Bacillota bacterium]
MKVEIKGVCKSFRQNGNGVLAAVEDINLNIAAGEFVCLLGPSGCGKSTLLNIVAGLDRPDRGRVLINGNPVENCGPDRGVVFQEGALFPWLTVLGNVEFALKMLRLPRKECRERADRYLQMVHLSQFVHCYPHELSGGMRQRAAIARTLAMEPEILLMDEPFSALDSQTRSLLHQELTEIWQATRKAVIFITHSVDEALALADRVVLFSARPGRIKKEFTVNMERPRDLNHPKIIMLQREIRFHLQEELEKVVEEQKAYEYAHAKIAVLPAVNNHLGNSL